MSYKFEMPWPPSINGYWRSFNNRQIISKRGRDYRKEALEKLRNLDLLNENISFPVIVYLTLNPPTLRKYDIDNFNKALFDALSHANFWNDDEQVVALNIRKGAKVKGGNVQVRVELQKQT